MTFRRWRFPGLKQWGFCLYFDPNRNPKLVVVRAGPVFAVDIFGWHHMWGQPK